MKELVKPNKFEEQAHEVETFCEPNQGCFCGCLLGGTLTSTEDEDDVLF